MSLTADIERFFADRTVQSAIEASRETQPLRICYPSEVPVSRFLAWLLDPSQGHGLSGAVLRRLLTACWDTATAEALPPAIKRRIAPSQMATQSFADVVIDREIQITADSGRLDVLVLVPSMKLLVAIENKFGARETRNQLKRYRTALHKKFDDWHRVHVYLDLNGTQPSDPDWIGLDYDWLIEELKIAEQSAWLGDEPRRSIREFRVAIDVNNADNNLPGIAEQSLLDMVLDHPTVFEIMGEWSRSKVSITSMASIIFAENDPTFRLFPVYCRRSDLWQQCIPLRSYALLRKAAQARFEDLEWDPKRSAFYFALKRWTKLRRADGPYWPIQVMVREQFGVEENERFVVISHLYSNCVDEPYVASALSVAVEVRKKFLNGRKMQTGVKRATLRVDYASTQQEAAACLCDHLTELSETFSSLLVHPAPSNAKIPR